MQVSEMKYIHVHLQCTCTNVLGDYAVNEAYNYLVRYRRLGQSISNNSWRLLCASPTQEVSGIYIDNICSCMYMHGHVHVM